LDEDLKKGWLLIRIISPVSYVALDT